MLSNPWQLSERAVYVRKIPVDAMKFADNDFDLFSGGLQPEPIAPKPKILTVTELTKKIRQLLEREIDSVWMKGEISNFRFPGSGHLYFSIKDEGAVISAVMFRGAAASLSFRPEDGQAVEVYGRVSVYEQRGQYQLIVESMQPQGKGTLQERFELLKRKLQAEGLFDVERKRALPIFPERIGIVTSLQGAVLQDFCRILARRAPGIVIQVYGCRVQGDEAAGEVGAGIAEFNRRAEVDLIVIARGGGSLEDLWAFNEEKVVRALAASQIPTISAIGHETDFTLADFVADLRAPTPSAAAELVSRDWSEWREEVAQREIQLRRTTQRTLQTARERWQRLAESYVFREPIRMVEQWQQRLDDLTLNLSRGLASGCRQQRHQLEQLTLRWQQASPRQRWVQCQERLQQWEARLKTLGPEATLARGYALVTDSRGELVRDADQLKTKDKAEVRLARGKLNVIVVGVQGSIN